MKNGMMDTKKTGIKTGITAGVSMLVVVGLLVLKSSKDFEGTIIAQTQQRLLTIAKTQAENIENVFEQIPFELKTFAATPTVQTRCKENIRSSDVPQEAYSPGMTLFAHLQDTVGSIYRLDSKGIVQSISPFKEGVEGTDFSKEPDVEYVLENYREHFGYTAINHWNTNELFTAKSGKGAIFICVPVLENTKLIGLLRASIYLDTINNMIDSIKVGRKGCAQIIDDNGRMVAYPKYEYIGTDVIAKRKEAFPNHDWADMEDIVEKMSSGAAGVGVYHSAWWQDEEPELVKKLTAFAPIRVGDKLWSLGVTMCYDEVSGPVKAYVRGVGIRAGLLTLVFAGGGFWFYKNQKEGSRLLLEAQSAKKLQSINQQLESEIINRKLNEDRIQQQSEFLKSVIESLSYPFYVIDANDYTIKMANSAGRKGELPEKATCYMVSHKHDKPCDGTEHPCPLKEVKETKKPVVVEHVYYDNDGNPRNIEVHCFPVFDVDGNVFQVIEYSMDITNRKQAEVKLTRLATIAEQAGEGIVFTDMNGIIQFVNQSWIDMHGYESKEELIGKPLRIFHTDEQIREDVVPFNEEVKRKGNSKGEVGHVRKDGTLFPAEMITTLLKDDSGTPEGLIGFATDITERKRMEEQLRQERDTAQRYLNLAGVMFVAINTDGEVSLINRKGCEVLGYDIEEIVGKNWFDKFIPERIREELRSISHKLLAGETRGVEYYENQIMAKTGEERLIAWNNVILRNEQGECIGHLSSGEDITERKQAEEKFRILYESTSDAVMLLDEKGFFDCNNATVRIFGCKDKADFCSKHPADLSPATQPCGSDSKELANQRITTAMEKGSNHFEWVHQKIDGTEFSADVLLNAMELAGKKVIQAVVRDITERKKLESQLRQAEKMQSIGQLASGIAHEINTPIQYIGDNINFLQDSLKDILRLLSEYEQVRGQAVNGSVDSKLLCNIQDTMQEVDIGYLIEETPRAIQESLDGVGVVTRIVQAMKEFAHPGAQERTSADINQAIESTITVTRNRWKYVANLETDFDSELPPVPCLVEEFNQVILNLIVNASDAIVEKLGEGSEDKGMISISTRQDGEWAEIRVADTGSGIPEEIHERILDPFFTTKEVGKGSGQGLAIAYAIVVDKHRGTLTFETEMGKGTTFIIRLPIEQDVPSGDVQDEEAYSIC